MFFEKTLEKIKTNYKDQIEINQIRSVPYQEYITLYNHCHILLDQTYAYSQVTMHWRIREKWFLLV